MSMTNKEHRMMKKFIPKLSWLDEYQLWVNGNWVSHSCCEGRLWSG